MNHCIALTWSYKWKFSHINVIKIAFCSFEKVFAHTCCPLPHLALLTRSVQSQFFVFFCRRVSALHIAVIFIGANSLSWDVNVFYLLRVCTSPWFVLLYFTVFHFKTQIKVVTFWTEYHAHLNWFPLFFLICGNRKWNYLSCCQLRTVPTIESLSKFYMQKADCTPLCPFAEWPSRWTNLTLRVCHSRIRTRLSSPTTNSWRRSGSTPRAARSTASWASAGLSYPFCDLRRILELPQQLWAALQRAVRRT